jgi:tetratricopeptide (TPR) repeat protein
MADLTEILELKVAVRQVSGSLSYLIGRVRASLEFIDEALSLMASDPGMRSSLTLQGTRPYALAASLRAEWPLAVLGRLDESFASINQAFDQWAEGAEPELLATLHWYATQIAFWRGDADGARTHARACIEITERAHLPGLFRAISRHLLGMAHILDDDCERAIARFQEHLRLAEETGAVRYREAEVLALLAAAYLGAGDHAAARTAAERALVVARRQGTRLYECDAHLAIARVMLTAEGTCSEEAIRATLEDALALAKETEAKTYEPFVRVELAELARVTGDDAGRERELREAYRLFIEIGAPLRADALTSGNPLPPRAGRASPAPWRMGS